MSNIFTTDFEPQLYIPGTHTLDEIYALDYVGAKYMIVSVGTFNSGIVEVSEFLVIHDLSSAQVSNIITTGNRTPNVMSFAVYFLRDHLRLTMTNSAPLKSRLYRTLIPTQ
jgi:hypothetical protein